MSFTEFLQVPELAQRYQKVRRFFFLKESTYDVTSACQLRCDGCYYFAGDKYKVKDNRDPEAWREFIRSEKERGITYIVLAGAEPALAPKILQACYDEIPFGTIASNGLRKIDPAVRYKIHLSVWGDSQGDPKYRKYFGGKPGPNCLPIQLENYRGDDRVIFVYTFNRENVDQVDEVIEQVAAAGHKITFNVFSTPEESSSALKLQDMRTQTRKKMIEAMERYEDTVLYSYYNAEIHTDEQSLDQKFGCIYPRAQLAAGRAGSGLTKTFRSYRTDLTHTPETDCCVPDTDCADCRHYAAGSAIVSSRLDLHCTSEEKFRAWLDYVDTYLSIWVLGYTKDPDLLYRPKDQALPVPFAATADGGREMESL
ncbi:MAG TPA: radical SAM protein [Thermoanaerobaculia bacterium]|nr:radical SAM protein [Thermoanaerobaculia bacterium]